MGIKHAPTIAYHPQSNGMVERFQRQLKNSLRARLASADWVLHLPWVLLGVRIAPKDITNVSSAELLYGSTPTVPGDFLGVLESPPEVFLSRVRALLNQQSPFPTHNSTPIPSSVPDQLRDAKFVFILHDAPALRSPPLYHGPYLVLERGSKIFRLKIGDREDSISVDRLKAAISETELSPAAPPRRGRPPRSRPSTITTSVSPPPVTDPPTGPTRRQRGRPRKHQPPVPPVFQPRRPRGRPRIIHQLDHRIPQLGGRYCGGENPTTVENDVTLTWQRSGGSEPY